MKFFKDPAHIRTLLLYLLASGAVCGVCFYFEMLLGVIVTAVCFMFCVFRLMGDVSADARLREMSRRVERTMEKGEKPAAPSGGRSAMSELDAAVYRLALRASDLKAENVRREEEHDLLLRGVARHLIQRAEELPANVHRRELIALAHDMENLADLPEDTVMPAEIEPYTAAEVWRDAAVLAEETLRLQQIRMETEVSPRAYVTTCPRDWLIHGMRGLLETCARHADIGSSWTCTAKETAVFTEFRVSGDRFDWSAELLPSLFGDHSAEPALLYLYRVAEICRGEARAERGEGGVTHLIFRLYKADR